MIRASSTAAAEFVAARIGDLRPIAGITLGSGLGAFADTCIEPVAVLDYAEIPGFFRCTVREHKGRLIAGRVGACPLLCLQGRMHLYEGASPPDIVLPVRMLAALGVHTLLLTNAAGGIRPGFSPGTLMLIRDHINMLGCNPLTGPNDDTLGPRFPDMTNAWDPGLRGLLRDIATRRHIPLEEGVYLAVPGPSYETPAEVRAFRILGADAVGMSTVLECIAARHLGLRVAGLSCITNLAAGIGDQPLSHDEVAATANAAQPQLHSLLEGFLAALH
jgi:inosine/guanosine/xanthosine phosphorylase family protein